MIRYYVATVGHPTIRQTWLIETRHGPLGRDELLDLIEAGDAQCLEKIESADAGRVIVKVTEAIGDEP